MVKMVSIAFLGGSEMENPASRKSCRGFPMIYLPQDGQDLSIKQAHTEREEAKEE